MNSSFSFNSSWCQNIARAARNGINCSPHTATTKFAFSYVFIILLCLDEAAEDGLEGHENHGLRALGGGLPAAVADGVLGLQGEEEAGGEAIDEKDAGRPAGRLLEGRQVLRQQVAVEVAGDVVEDSKEQPGQVEAGRKHHHHPQPRGV